MIILPIGMEHRISKIKGAYASPSQTVPAKMNNPQV